MSDTEKNSSPPSDALQNEMLSELLSKLSGSAAQPSPSQGTGTSQQSQQAFSKSAGQQSPDILSALLSNPDLIAKLPSLISSIKPIIEMLGSSGLVKGVAEASEKPFKDESASVGSIQANSSSSHKGGEDSRAALLCAMKPYLSRDRQNAIDYIIKISRLGDILKTL